MNNTHANIADERLSISSSLRFFPHKGNPGRNVCSQSRHRFGLPAFSAVSQSLAYARLGGALLAIVLVMTSPDDAALRAATTAAQPDVVEHAFDHPSNEARIGVYWWWLNGCVSKDGIVRDLDHMKGKGIGSAVVFQAGQGATPFTTEFMSDAWRGLFRFAVQEAARRGIVIGLNLCHGWNAGGPWVRPDEAAQVLVRRTLRMEGGGMREFTLVRPGPGDYMGTDRDMRKTVGATGVAVMADDENFYRDIAVLAWRIPATGADGPHLDSRTMVNLTDRLHGDRLSWDAPPGEWEVVRFGHCVGPLAWTKCGGGKCFLEIDPLRSDAMDKHFAATAGVVLRDVQEHVGTTFQHVTIDSSELGSPDWTPAFREEFRKRRGYDCFPYLAARVGAIMDTAEITARFNEDFARTLGDLMTENYYGRLTELAHQNGLKTHSEAAGFQKPCVDALAALGRGNDISMSEFWARGSEYGEARIHQLSEAQAANHDGIRTAASAAHVYGSKIVQAEAFTTSRRGKDAIYPNWDRGPFELKDVGDRAFCAGMNRMVLHQFVHQPDELARPGYKWPGIGNEFDRLVTWSPASQGYFEYLARCQSLLQRGEFVADACYFEGESVPDFVPARWAMSPALPAGFDFDAINAEVLTQLARISKDGRLSLDGGMSYRYLVLSQRGPWRRIASAPVSVASGSATPDGEGSSEKSLVMSPATLRSIKQMVEQGMTLVGPPPHRAIGLGGYPESDVAIERLAAGIWGAKPAESGERRLGAGRVIWGRSLEDIFRADRLAPDLTIEEDEETRQLASATLSGIPNPDGSFDWIHRRIEGTEVYFIANLRNARASGSFSFRVRGRQPELWDPVTGRKSKLGDFVVTEDGLTRLPLAFDRRQSFFIVFRSPSGAASHAESGNITQFVRVAEFNGPWEVSFDPKWGGPERITFDTLTDWSRRPEDGIRHYSGKATYRMTFDLPGSSARASRAALYLDLGVVKNVAAVRLNGSDLGTVWTAPWHVEISGAVKRKGNMLEVDVYNLWPNRLIGDAGLPPEQRRTVTNVGGFRADAPLLPSGLLGPVSITRAQYR